MEMERRMMPRLSCDQEDQPATAAAAAAAAGGGGGVYPFLSFSLSLAKATFLVNRFSFFPHFFFFGFSADDLSPPAFDARLIFSPLALFLSPPLSECEPFRPKH